MLSSMSFELQIYGPNDDEPFLSFVLLESVRCKDATPPASGTFIKIENFFDSFEQPSFPAVRKLEIETGTLSLSHRIS